MSKKKNRIAVILLTIMLMVTGIITFMFNSNTSIAFPYEEGKFTNISGLTNNRNLYCIDRGKEWKAGTYYCYSVGPADSGLAYLVANQTNSNRDPDNDTIANAVWDYIEGKNNPLVEEARAIAQVAESGNIVVTSPENPIVDEGNGYGPFVIEYPTYNGSIVGKITILLNGKKYSDIPESGTPFYLTEEDGVIYGQANSVEILYEATTYKGTEAYLTPVVELVRVLECPECGYGCNMTLEQGVVLPDGSIIEYGSSSWKIQDDEAKHKIEYEYVTDRDGNYVYDNDGNLMQEEVWRCTYYDRNTWRKSWATGAPELSDKELQNSVLLGRGPGWQDLIYIEAEEIPVSERVPLSFWAGKPKIQLQLDKINGKKESIADATFNVTVDGGKIDSLDGSASATVGGTSIIEIVAGKKNDNVTVTLEETYAPDDYVKLTGPIQLTFTFNGKTWECNSINFPEGEKVEIEATGLIREATNCSDLFKLTAVDRPTIKIELDKKDTMGQTVPVSFDIAVTGGKLRNEASIRDGGKAIIEPEIGATSVTVTLTENDPGEKYVRYKVPIVINFTSDSEQTSWTMSSYTGPTDPEKVTVKSEENKATIYAINRRTIIVELNKIDNSSEGNPLAGITFDIGVTGGKCRDDITSVTTDGSGYAKIIIEPDGEGDVTLTLTERYNNYYIDEGPITIRFTYQGGCWSDSLVNSSNSKIGELVAISGTQFEFLVNIKNRAKIEEITLVKLNKFFPDETIDGITFNILLENAQTLSGATSITRQTDINGQIQLGILEVLDPTKDVTFILKETGSPTTTGLNYRGLENATIEITVKHRQAGCEMVVTGGKEELVEADYDHIANVVDIEVKNEVTLDLSGKVWLDGQTGLKPVSSPNGTQDNNEKGLENVTVTLQRTPESSVPETGNSVPATKVTDSNGNYEFKDIPASTRDKVKYYIEFTYDGINYIATTPNVGNDETIDSDASEIGRTEFNNKFHTITKDTATAASAETISLEYDYDATSATLKTMDGTNVKDKYAMTATTMPTTYNRNTTDIDLGLTKRGVDLAAVTDIYSAKVTINGKEQTYDYNDIRELEEDENGNPILKSLEYENAQYNLYLYKSDYNYRIGDYRLDQDEGINTAAYEHRNELTVNENNASSNLLAQRQSDGDLNIEVTYQVLLNNQSATEATIHQIAYYYDTGYTLVLAGATPELVNINGKTYNKVILDVNKVFTDSDNQGVAELVFAVGKDSSGNVYTQTMQNWVEIISYSTNEGCIDIDSAPDNIEIHSQEDDTDDAAGLNIQLNNIEREVSGYVFEDTKSDNQGQYNTGNGKYDDNENKIDDVIVQLIEVKDVTVGNTTLRLEYIWQETVSGSNKVIYVTSDGTTKGEYTVTNEPGHYTFNQNIIPGDYIVRFIYGDGTYYDSESAANLTKYNGQDYKSTTDIYYWKPNYDVTYPANNSMARDNEARRLEEMAYARTITADNIAALKIDTQDELKSTWMCAETSPIWMKISDADVEGDNTNSITRGVNFGLVERPKASLVLEKHITALKIGSGSIAEARTSLENYDSAEGIVKLDYNNGVIASKTDKELNERGEWLVQVQADEVAAQRLEITYSYRIKNNGDIEYIGEELRNQELAGKTYETIAQEVKTLSATPNSNYKLGTYLGTAYYSGTRTTDVIAAIPFQVEDYMSTTNGLKLNTATSDFNVTNPNSPERIWDYVSTDASEKNATNDKTEEVSVLQSKEILTLNLNQQESLELSLYDSIDSISGKKEISYRSYAAQLIYPITGAITSTAGTLVDGEITLGNLTTVQSYVDDLEAVPVKDIVPEADEFIAETVTITLDTGADKQTPVILITTITAGLAVVAVGIVLIRKFIIK